MHPRILEVTARLTERSRATRERYLQLIRGAASEGPMRASLQCANFAPTAWPAAAARTSRV